ncbi:hypothetical protein SLEP1_g50815 [Rubroshorea leprosula]|uniref:NADH dehydrogenase subunit 4L n=1 Tax=Rubroshorea leprosula TaxID=152421 RepID=A0AAV5M176_9ROSI|nr:hypothetical protein SLEP1_g50815 [Rubroshorea leprosula]
MVALAFSFLMFFSFMSIDMGVFLIIASREWSGNSLFS